MTKIGIDRYNFHDNILDLEEEEEARKADQAEATILKQQKKISEMN